MPSGQAARIHAFDWLRIGAFGLLILYHLGMFYVPWPWHVKSSHIQGWLADVMLAVAPWRLPLLFLISGAASRHMLEKLAGRRFLAARTVRLLPPILVSVGLIVPPQSWLELVEKAGYAEDFLYFWRSDYFEFGASRGLILPTWNHMWFVVYLWFYTLLLGGLAGLFGNAERLRGLQRRFDALFGGWRWLVLPLPVFLIVRQTLFPAFGSTHALIDDFFNHAQYGLLFLLGVGFAGSHSARDAVLRHWKIAAVLAILGYAGLLGTNALRETLAQGGAASALLAFAKHACRTLQMWSALVALLGLAFRLLDRDNAARRYLTEALFPYYIVHQTIIVVAGHYLAALEMSAGAEFLLLAVITLGGCALTYEVVRRIGWLRPWFGLRLLRAPRG